MQIKIYSPDRHLLVGMDVYVLVELALFHGDLKMQYLRDDFVVEVDGKKAVKPFNFNNEE